MMQNYVVNLLWRIVRKKIMSKPYVNLCKKWRVTPEEIKEFMEFIVTKKGIGDWCGDINVLFAASDLMCSGDIDKKEE